MIRWHTTIHGGTPCEKEVFRRRKGIPPSLTHTPPPWQHTGETTEALLLVVIASECENSLAAKRFEKLLLGS